MFTLSEAHMAQVNRKRRAITHYDAYTVAKECGGIEEKNGLSLFEVYKKRLWGFIDNLDHTLDSIHWDACMEDEFAFAHRSRLPQIRDETFRKFFNEGHDIYDEFVNGSKARGMECVLTYRVSGTNLPQKDLTPSKLTHPEYYLDDWMRMANLASEGMKKMKVDMLTECIENYAFDGLEIDFCRHTPFLEPGKQWELREHVTNFMRTLREMTLRLEKEQNRVILLSARVPETVEGCHIDGIDIENWAKEKIVDTLTLGTRSFEVDIPGFRRATKGSVKLFPCFDAHHQSDAYADPALPIYAGVFSTWWDQGADAIALFNLYACSWKTYIETCIKPVKLHVHHQEEVLAIVGRPEKLWSENKVYVVERKGGYPWGNGFANLNNYKQLPRILKNSGAKETVILYVSDPVYNRNVESVTLETMVYGLRENENLRVFINDVEVFGKVDNDYADKQVLPLQLELVSGYHTDWIDDRHERFRMLSCKVCKNLIHKGENFVSVFIERNPDYSYADKIELERVELHVRYRRNEERV